VFGIGTPEFLLIGFIAFILLKPEDLPGMMRKLGEAYGKVLRIYHRFLDEMDAFEDAIKNEEEKKK
jgi:Sec-independent protein translocase protein TatA